MNTEERSESESTLKSNETPGEPNRGKAPAEQELHKPPVLLFFLPLVVIIVIAYLTR